jgi:hypothetical protein
MLQAKDGQVWTMYYGRLIGYFFLILTFLDLVETFYPPLIKDPNWLLPVVGLLVERSFVPMVGLILVFWGAGEYRSGWERPIIKSISWLTLLVSLLYMLLIPLGVSAGLRIDKQNHDQAMTQYRQGTAQLNQIKNQIDLATDKDFNTLLQTLKQQNQFKVNTVEELKTKLPEQLDKALENLAAQTLNVQKEQRKKLLKSLIKWELGALIIATAFLLTWRSTQWARKT